MTLTESSLSWYPCEHPERPNDPFIVWHESECVGCHIAAVATVRRHPDDPIVALVMPSIVARTEPDNDNVECWL